MSKKPIDLCQKNVRLLLAMSVAQNAMFIVPILVIFYKDEIGLGFREFMIGEAVFALVVILMEVPSGWLSDIWNRKRTLMVGQAFYLLGFFMLFQADTLAAAIVAQGIFGVAVSLISGTNTAFLYDTLLAAGRKDQFQRLEGLRHGIGLYSAGFVSLLGGFLYQIDHGLPFVLSMLTSLAALVITLFMTEPKREMQAPEKHLLADIAETMRYALHGHAEIAGIILFSTTVFVTTKIMFWAQQSYYIMLDLPAYWFGILLASSFILGGLGAQISHRFDGRVKNRTIFGVMLAVVSLACLVAGFLPGYHAVPLLLCGTIMFGFGWPRVQDAINKRVGSERRATILSTASLMVNLTFIPLGALMGAMEGRYGINASLAGMGLCVLIAGGCALAFTIRRMRQKERVAAVTAPP